MNRRKKITQILTKKDKKANAKKCQASKPRYISKAAREADLCSDPVTPDVA
ncbi:MAG: DUF2986 domain-containing protein [Motiliproteus sp.]